MFGWSKKKDTKRRGRPERSEEENEFGIKLDKGPSDKQLEAELKALAGVDSFPEDDLNLNEADEDPETELLRLIGGGKGKMPKRKPAAATDDLGDITADITADVSIDDEDVEVDENDEELLGELLELTQPEDAGVEEEEPESDSEPEDKPSGGDLDVMGILKERLKMYKTAEAKAKENNENSRARRFSRGIKTIEDLIKKAKAGKAVSPNDIPPVIALNLKPAPPLQPEMSSNEVEGDGGMTVQGTEEAEETSPNTQGPSSQSEAEDMLTTLMERLKLYKTAEEKAKEGGETTRARRFNRGIKTLEGLIKEAKAGKPISPSDIPPVVALNLKPAPPVQVQKTQEENMDNNEETNEDEMGNINLAESPEESEEPQAEPERNIMDVLSERLQMYKTAETKAKKAGELTRARRFARGIKTIQDLIRQATAGRPIPADDIPPVIALNLKPAPPITVAEEIEETDLETERENLVQSSDIFTNPLAFSPADDVEREDLVQSSDIFTNPLAFSPANDVEREDLVQSSDIFTKPLAFSPVDDVDLDAELMEEETPTTVLEGLEQRVRFYTRFQKKAQKEGNAALADENQRIVTVYQNAIKTYRKGGYVDVLRLPNPNGCPPIPIPFYSA